jgi:hypothetical protein
MLMHYSCAVQQPQQPQQPLTPTCAVCVVWIGPCSEQGARAFHTPPVHCHHERSVTLGAAVGRAKYEVDVGALFYLVVHLPRQGHSPHQQQGARGTHFSQAGSLVSPIGLLIVHCK